MQFYLVVQPESMWKAVQHTTVVSKSLIMAMFDHIWVYFTSLLAYLLLHLADGPVMTVRIEESLEFHGVSLPHLIAGKHTIVQSRQLKSQPFFSPSVFLSLQLAILSCLPVSCLMAMRLLRLPASYGWKVQNKAPRMVNSEICFNLLRAKTNRSNSKDSRI